MSTSWLTLKQKTAEAEERFNSQSLRERILIALSIFAVIYMVWTFVFNPGLESRKQALDTRLSDVQTNMTRVLSQEKVFTKALANDPNANVKYEILQLQEKLKALDQDLQGLSVGLIPASNFASVIEDVLSANATLTLLGMTTLKPERLNFDNIDSNANSVDEDDESIPTEDQKQSELIQKLSALEGSGPTNSIVEQEVDQNQVGVFKHSIRVNISGKYFDVVNYLRALEELPWTFYWSNIDYQVNKKNRRSPEANVVFEIYTLSTDSGVFGV